MSNAPNDLYFKMFDGVHGSMEQTRFGVMGDVTVRYGTQLDTADSSVDATNIVDVTPGTARRKSSAKKVALAVMKFMKRNYKRP